jgi:hypothetical protein
MAVDGKPAVPQSRLLQAGSRSLRLALVVLIAWFGFSLVRTARDLFGSSSEPAPVRSTEAPLPGGLEELLGGGWSFGDAGWLVRLDRRPASEALASLHGEGEAPVAGSRVSQLEQALLRWLRMAGRPAPLGNLTVRSAQLKRRLVRAVTEGKGAGERLRLLQMAWPMAGGEWSFLEARPKPGARQGDAAQHLLPLPREATRVAQRWDRAGELSGELVGPTALGPLEETWRAAGWSVQPLPVEEMPGETRWYRRGDEAVLVVIFGKADSKAAYLLLVPGAAVNKRTGGS